MQKKTTDIFISPTVVLNFRMKDLQREKDQGKLKLQESAIFPGLERQTVLMSGGSKLYVDQDDVIVFGYFPGYIGIRAQVAIVRTTVAWSLTQAAYRRCCRTH
jgi:hypothetical protein